MKILVSGSHGFIGQALVTDRRERGDEVIRLVRSNPGEGEILWDPVAGAIDPAALEGFDAVIHLAGESIFGVWTRKKKARIRQSRVEGTTLLSNALAQLTHKPRVFACASAYGIYGEAGNAELDENARHGDDFLARVVAEWERAAQPVIDHGIRTVNLRFGLVLDKTGGMLATMLLPFRLGLGGKLATGKQYMSWITRDDLIRGIDHVLAHEELSGPVNVVGPEPVTNKIFTKALGAALRRPTVFTIPRFLRNLPCGAGEAFDGVTFSTRALPVKLQQSGFEFLHPQLDGALRHTLRHNE